MNEKKYRRIAEAIGMEHTPAALRCDARVRPYRWPHGAARVRAEARLFERRIPLLGMRMRGEYHRSRNAPHRR